MNLFRRRFVLNEFYKVIAKNHFPRRYRNSLSDLEFLGAFRRFPRTQTLEIVEIVIESAHEIKPGLA